MKIGHIRIRERGPTPRRLVKVYNASSKEAYYDVGLHFHSDMRDERFTNEHAEKAGYHKRKGEAQPRESKSFRRSYTGRKFRQFGHTRPMEFSGDTRQAMRTASISSTSKSVRVRYPGSNKLSYKHPKSQIKMQDEFRTLLDSEITTLAELFDRRVDDLMAANQETSTTTI